jgi:hypothetical protein
VDRTTWAVVTAVLLVIVAVYARARWPGFLPLGSDNDEYQLAGQALAAFEAPLIAGTEGTKYPLGYPALLAVLQWVGLPVAPAALALNLVAVAATVGLLAHLAGRATASSPASPGAALATGAVLATSVSVWNDVYSVMPEMALLVTVAAMLTTLQQPLVGRRLVTFVVLAVIAVLFKTLAILLLLGGCGLVWLLAHRRGGLVTDDAAPADTARTRARAMLPAGAALATALVGLLVGRTLPEHTTGYVATFALEDPFDASLGRLGPVGLLRRSLADVPDTLTDLGRAIALIDAGTAVAVSVAVLGLMLGVVAAHRLRPGSPLGAFTAGAALAYAIGMTTWPFHSSRFGIPLVPIAALGAGWLVRLATDHLSERRSGTDADVDARVDAARQRWASLAVGGVITALLVATSAAAVVDRGEAGAERLAQQHAAMDRLETLVAQELEGERLVSFDYREVAHRLDRPVAPLSYTTDTRALLDQVGDAEAVVMVDFNARRNGQLALLIEAYPERFDPLLEDAHVAVYRVVR